MQKKIIQFFLGIIVICSFTHNFPLQLAVNALTLMVVFPYGRINVRLLKTLAFALFPVLLGFYGVFIHALPDLFRDFYYFINPFLFAAIGFSLASKMSLRNGLRTFVGIGIFYSLIHLSLTLFVIVSTGSFNFLKIRDEVSPGNAITLISLFILFFHRKYDIDLGISNLARYSAITLNIIVFILFGSRTYLISLLFFLFFLAFEKIKFKQIAYSALVVTAFVGFLLVTGGAGGGESASFTDKLLVSFTEMALKDYSTVEDMANNLRGFEAFMAFQSYFNANTFQKLFGQGFGALIDLQTYIPYGETERRFVPIIHNGYLFILIKTGFFGMIAYLGWFAFIYRKGASIANEQKENKTLIFLSKNSKAAIVSLLLTNLVITGFFNSETAFLQIFIFLCFSYIITESK